MESKSGRISLAPPIFPERLSAFQTGEGLVHGPGIPAPPESLRGNRRKIELWIEAAAILARAEHLEPSNVARLEKVFAGLAEPYPSARAIARRALRMKL